jgi:membrane associated rhomboid family serine protease
MKVLALKLRYLYAPFLIVVAGFVAVYSLLAWALVYRTGLLNLDEELVTWWLPFGLAWIPAWLWIWPRIKVLKLETKKGKLHELYLWVAAAAMIWPTVQAQMYLSKMTGTTIRLSEVADISSRTSSKYYTVERPCLRREESRTHFAAELGRRQENVNYTISVAVPFCGKSGAPPGTVPPAWLALTFTTWTKSSNADGVKEATARRFAEESEATFKRLDLGGFKYLESLGPGDKRRGFETAIRKAYPEARVPVLLVPHMGALEERAGTEGDWALGAFGSMATLWLLMLLVPDIHVDRLRLVRDGARAGRAGENGWRSFLTFGRSAFGTTMLAAVIVVVFLAMVFAGLGVVGFHFEDLVGWGALSRPLLRGAGLLRLVTYQFVHGGLMHIVNNLYGLFFAGLMLESVIGGRRLLVAYLSAGVFGGVASVLVHPATVTVGASGSIFGLFGVLFGLLLVKDERVAPARNFLLINAGIYVGLNLLLGAVMPGVDNAAHVGGLLAGLLMGPFLRKGSTGKGRPVLRLSGTDL